MKLRLAKDENDNSKFFLEIPIDGQNKQWLLRLRSETGNEFTTDMVMLQVEKQLQNALRRLREKSYHQGFNAGRGHRTRQTFFPESLDLNMGAKFGV